MAARRHARAPRPTRPSALALCFASRPYAGLTKPDRRQTQFYWNALYVSSFYSSWAETVETLWRGQLIEAADAATAPPFELPEDLHAGAKPPHIVLIHQESVVQPGLFPKLAYDRGVDRLFQLARRPPAQAARRDLWRRLVADRVLDPDRPLDPLVRRHAPVRAIAARRQGARHVPETLARCGYRNVLFYPMLKNFVSNGRFYDAVGLKEIFDLKAQGAKTEIERDRFYYRNALDEMERHIKSSAEAAVHLHPDHVGALALRLRLRAGHEGAGGGPGTDPEMHEYLRRVSIAKIDSTISRPSSSAGFPASRS